MYVVMYVMCMYGRRPELYRVPISERLGSTHLSLSASHIHVATRPKVSR